MNNQTKREASGDKWFQLFGIILWISILFLSLGNYNGSLYSIESTMNLVGLIQFIVGLSTMIYAQLNLGHNYSGFLVIKKDHELIKHGLYKHVRHPVYTGGIIVVFSIPVYTSSVLGFFAAILLTIPAHSIFLVRPLKTMIANYIAYAKVIFFYSIVNHT